MAIPGYQDFMLPLLKAASDGKEHTVSDTMDVLAGQMGLTETDRNVMLPSGTQTRFYNRITWAITYLSKSLLLEKTGRGRFKISARGSEVLAKNPPRVDNAFLDQFPEYKAFKSKRADQAVKTKKGEDVSSEVDDPEITPDERLDGAYKELRATLADDLLERVRAGTPKFFEHLVVDLLVAMGYGGSLTDAAQVVGRSGDDGIDGVIKEDRLGLDMVYIQAKKWDNSVGPGEIDRFVGSLMPRRPTRAFSSRVVRSQRAHCERHRKPKPRLCSSTGANWRN